MKLLKKLTIFEKLNPNFDVLTKAWGWLDAINYKTNFSKI